MGAGFRFRADGRGSAVGFESMAGGGPGAGSKNSENGGQASTGSDTPACLKKLMASS